MSNVPNFKFALTDELIQECERLSTKENPLDPSDWLPSRAEDRDTGWDVRCAEPGGIEMIPGCYLKIPLGIHMLAPEGWWLELRPRSSSFAKRHLHSLYGVIDELYPGQLIFACQFVPCTDTTFCRNNLPRIEFGDRIAQVRPVKRKDMIVTNCTLKELKEEHERRNSKRMGGFGSTGAK